MSKDFLILTIIGTAILTTLLSTTATSRYGGILSLLPSPVVNVWALNVTGTEGPDTLTGTADKDTIRGFGGDDSISGLEGGDKIRGGDGDDTMHGEEGGDRIRGNQGNDIYLATTAMTY
jgi:Ca2+-binding RTX toxin-like protein